VEHQKFGGDYHRGGFQSGIHPDEICHGRCSRAFKIVYESGDDSQVEKFTLDRNRKAVPSFLV
jgi:hypothetical protein